MQPVAPQGRIAVPENIPMIECKGVWKAFGARADAAIHAMESGQSSKADVLSRYGCSVGVADANLQVQRGEVFCIMGLSGSGKSTLLRHINRLIDPTTGEISIDGERIDRMSAAELRRLRWRCSTGRTPFACSVSSCFSRWRWTRRRRSLKPTAGAACTVP